MAVNARVALAVGASLALHAAALSYVLFTGLEAPVSPPGPAAGPAARGIVIGRVIMEPRPAVRMQAWPGGPAALPASPQALSSAPGVTQADAPDAAIARTAIAKLPVPAVVADPPSASASAPSAAPGKDAAFARFQPASQLSARPVVIDVGDLEPEWLDQIRGAAVATVSVYVEADGSVFHVDVRNASDPRIGEMARKAFERARFTPGMAQGKNVAARVDISLDYDQQRDRVRDPDAARPSGNVLAKEEIRRAPLLPADKPQLNLRPK